MLWLRQREPDEMLGGLWGFPLVETAPGTGRPLPKVHHAYTHFRVTATPLIVSELPAGTRGELIPRQRIPFLALSKLDHKILAVIPKD